jgi:ABC transporter substrate binding protein
MIFWTRTCMIVTNIAIRAPCLIYAFGFHRRLSKRLSRRAGGIKHDRYQEKRDRNQRSGPESLALGVFARLTELRAGGLVIGGDAFFTRHLKQLAALTVQYAVPAIYQYREFAAAGGLMSYGTNIADTHRLVGIYAARILKGANAADLPVQQATTKVEMFINFQTARALGITISLPLSGRADEIFE